MSIGLTLLGLAHRGIRPDAVDQAIAAFEDVLPVYLEAGALQNIAKVQSFLAEARLTAIGS